MFSSYPRNVFILSRMRSHPSREILFSRPGYALIPARKYSSPIPERFRPTKINFANIGKIPDSISLIDPETALRSANIRIFQLPGDVTCRSHCQFPGSATCKSHCQHCLRAIHLGRLVPSGESVSHVACLDEPISAAYRQGIANVDSCGVVSLPK